MPHLVSLRYSDIAETVLQFHEKYGEQQLKLEVLDLGYEKFARENRTSEQLELVCSMLPNVKELVIAKVAEFKPFFKLTQVSKLEIKAEESKDFDENLYLLLKHFSPTLTHLDLKVTDFESYDESSGIKMLNTSNIDLSVIAYHCLVIEDISLECNLECEVTKAQFNLDVNKHFTKLKSFSVNRHDLGVSKTRLPVDVIQCILSSEKLESVSMQYIIFPIKLWQTLIQEARTKEKIFSSLESWKFYACPGSPVDELADLISVAPKLKSISIEYNCESAEELGGLHAFVEDNRLDIKIIPPRGKKWNISKM